MGWLFWLFDFPPRNSGWHFENIHNLVAHLIFMGPAKNNEVVSLR